MLCLATTCRHRRYVPDILLAHRIMQWTHLLLLVEGAYRLIVVLSIHPLGSHGRISTARDMLAQTPDKLFSFNYTFFVGRLVRSTRSEYELCTCNATESDSCIILLNISIPPRIVMRFSGAGCQRQALKQFPSRLWRPCTVHTLPPTRVYITVTSCNGQD